MNYDWFYDYLEYNENAELIGPSEFVERFCKREHLAWSRLTFDLLDTWRAGALLRRKANNGSAAYVRKKGDRPKMFGMFDKDKQFAPDGRLDEMFPPGDTDSREGAEVILWEPPLDKGEFPTDTGTAHMTWLTVSSIMTPDEKKIVGTLSSPIAEKAKDANKAEFPCAVRVLRVSTDMQPALVLQWMGAYDPKKGTVDASA